MDRDTKENGEQRKVPNVLLVHKPTFDIECWMIWKVWAEEKCNTVGQTP